MSKVETLRNAPDDENKPSQREEIDAKSILIRNQRIIATRLLVIRNEIPEPIGESL